MSTRLTAGIQESSGKKPKDSRVQGNKGQLLREEARSRAIILAGTADPEGAEPDPPVAEAEVRRVVELTIGSRNELATGAVGVELLPPDLPLGVGQEHDADSESVESELVHDELLARPANRAPAMTESELRGDDQDVALLRFGELTKCPHCVRVNSQAVRRDLAIAVVVEPTGGRDLLVDEPNGAALLLVRIGHLGEELRCQRIHRRDSKPALGSLGEFGKVRNEPEGVAHVEAEDLGNELDLLLYRLRTLILPRVGVAGGDLLVSVLVGNDQLSDELRDTFLQFAAVLVESLRAFIIEPEPVVDGLE